ncbi:ATP-binding cassette sub-family A member 10-like isoform X1 [Thamnophis elegans]|uniref:ATP-binding cassette sub-family A member 10-like isoform X1 n=1 Tax=Thamnophis elegans TaxID=35005 RepID=UPI0013785897|nr:ATP-binding cassette sub-family A member 10-like isoform X1 [Thamnophis elegans]
MQMEYIRKRSLGQQTAALLWKNIILKWRMRMQSFQEWFCCLVLFSIILLSVFWVLYQETGEIPHALLGKPSFNITGVKLLYAPNTKMSREIIKKIETLSPLKGIETKVMEDEKTMKDEKIMEDEKVMASVQDFDLDIIGVVFQDEMSYRLRFPLYRTVLPHKGLAFIDTCFNFSSIYCENPRYWTQGFVSLQSSIDSALIERITNHSVWEEMTSINGIRMKSPSVTIGSELQNGVLLWTLSLCFAPFMYFLTLTLSREKRKLKELMKTMGLRDAAFWLSWGLLYTMYILIQSMGLTFCLKATHFYLSSSSILFVLFFLYGISSICLCFMLSSLLKKPRITSFSSFILIFCLGALNVATTIRLIPPSLELILSIFSPFAFGAGLSKILYFQKYGRTFDFTDLMFEPYGYCLLIDSLLYMLLAFYFDKVVPDKYGVPYPPLFFLKKTYWCKPKSPYTGDAPTSEWSHGSIFSDNAEPVPPEFNGKEVIRLNNIKKIYKMKSTETEALKGLSLDIYEGQITAILGHSTSGKTTLLNILSGLSKPSDGFASIFKYNVCKKEQMEKIWEISAICPQWNIQFEFLTVKENLTTFAKIKGIPSNAVEKEVEKLLTLLDIKAIQNTQANHLSGGQKRKLSLGVTFLGEPQVLLLDEPTSGLDPYSRHQVWSLLNERKADRVILFTTQFMDEADILSDRKAIISHGRLQCVGSSLFLKKKWGIGYHLRMHTNQFCDFERITSLVKHHIPAAKKSGQRENELSYTLPLQNVDKFSDLFNDMDHQTNLGLINYGVTMTTLEDVFLRLEGNENMKEEDYGILHEGEAAGKDETEQDWLFLSDTGKVTVEGADLWRQQVCAIARMHFLNLKRENKLWGTLLLLTGVMLAPYIIQFTNYFVWVNLQYEEIHPGLYFEPGKQFFKGTSGLLVLNNTGGKIDNFIQALKSQNILMDVISGNIVNDQLVHNGAIKVELENKKYRFTLMCHMEITNCFPVLVNTISNALLHMFNSTAHLRTWNHVFITDNLNSEFWVFMEIYMITASFILPAFPPQFAMRSNQDYMIRTRSQLRIAGLFPSAYWCGQALVDMPLNCILLLLVLWPWFLKIGVADPQFIPSLIFCLVAFFLGYSISIVLFLYIIAFIFRQRKHTASFWSVISILVMLLLFITAGMLSITVQYIGNLLSFFVPTFPVTTFIITFTRLLVGPYADEHDVSPLTPLFISTFMPYLQSIILIFLLRYLVMKYDQTVMRRDPIFRFSPRRKRTHQNPEELSQADDRDVLDERTRVQSALTSVNEGEKPVIIVHDLRKEYQHEKTCSSSCFKKKKEEKKVATRNVSFCVKKGEVLGLLGPNGAGKSTTINLITGDTEPSAGQVNIKGADGAMTEENAALGYCPQENALWSNLTMKEHLEIFAAVKGIRKDDATMAINRISQALELRGHLKKKIKTLAAGLSRKLCFALSILGNPTLILLDEPTTGLDPKGKRQVWRAIHTMLQDKEEGVILTTHHMEEAEMLCDRVAIMVSGQLRCLGSIQYLKNKFGKNYLLQIKVKGVEQGDLVNTQILKIFPQAARQERISTLLAYKIPMEDALPLSRAFAMLEDAKQRFSLEEYSFSLNTLEQVFLELCKEHERDYFELTPTSEWREL